MSVTIKNANSLMNVSPTQPSPLATAKYSDAVINNDNLPSTVNNSQSLKGTMIRKPILQGKIDSRAVLGLKKNLNTASNFSQIGFP